MKIDPRMRTFGRGSIRPEGSVNASAASKSFSGFLQQERQALTHEELVRRMQLIQQQGERLARSMTLRDLREYKMLVQRFLDDTVRKSIKLKETRGWDRRGRAKRYQLIETLDQTLLSMADELLATEQGRLELLDKMDEVRGLLIHLLF